MNSKTWKTALFVTSALVAGIAAAPIAQAAPAKPAASDATDLSVVVVTARRIEERLQDVPISITVFNQQTLAKANIVNSEDLARITPSLSVNDNYGSDNALFSIRGFVQDPGTAPAVGVFFADVVAPRGLTNAIPAGDGAGPGSFFDLQNVQVLKGPQGTLFGLNTTGGDILIVPQKPTSNFGGYIEGTYGNYDTRRLQAVVNLPVNDRVRLRLGVDRQINDGYIHNTSGIGPSHLGNVNYTAFRGSMVIDLTSNIENYTIGSVTHSDNYGDIQKIFAGPGTSNGIPGMPALIAAETAMTKGFYDVQQNEPHPQSKLDIFQIINTTTWKATDNLTVKNIVSYAELKDDLTSELFGVNTQVPFAGVTYPWQYAEVNHPAGVDTAHESTFTEELQFQGNAFDSRLTWQGGGYVEASLPMGGPSGEETGNSASCSGGGVANCTSPGTGGAINHTVGVTYAHDLAIYGQASYKLTDQFKLTAGYRYTWDHEENTSQLYHYGLATAPTTGPSGGSIAATGQCTDGNLGLIPPFTFGPRQPFPLAIPIPYTTGGCFLTSRIASNAPTYMADLDYTPTDNLLFYAKYARGYRAGTITPSISPPLNTTGAEHINSYEGGVKSTFNAPWHATADVAVFYNDFTNQQLQAAFVPLPPLTASAVSVPVNSPKSDLYGVEFNGSIVPYKGLTIDVGYAYLQSKIVKVAPAFSNPFTLPGYFLAAAVHNGDPVVNTPKDKVNVAVNYVLPLSPDLGRISVGMNYAHQDQMLANYTDLTAGPAYKHFSYLSARDLLDLSASWNGIYGSPVDLSFYGTNVTGQKYYSYAAGLSGVGDGFEAQELGQPTMYGVRLKYHFGR